MSEAQNKELLVILEQLAPDSSRATLRSLIKEKRVTVDGVMAEQAKMMISPDQEVRIGPRRKFLPNDIVVYYDDADLVILEKPAGLLSVASDFDDENTVHATLKDYYSHRKVGVVHRLDQDTSGVMVFALNDSARDYLKRLFRAHDIERQYTAIVEGHFKDKRGTWESYLFEDKNYYVHASNDPGRGDKAITHYEVVGKSRRYSRLLLTLHTGKKNQIRVQAGADGHPVVGDKKYRAETNPLRRLCLHACHLAFQHPTKEKMMRFHCPVPVIFDKLVKIRER